MKHLKKLSAAFMLAALFSFSLTSCIDDNVDPIVEAIYSNQAALIAAQAGVQNAQATLFQAQAAAQQAQAQLTLAQAAQAAAYTAQITAETANYIADTAYEAAQREQYLLLLVAQTNRDVAAAQNALALANAQFDLDMAALAADLAEAGVLLASDYAYSYMTAMNAANDILADKLAAENNLANALLMQTGAAPTSWAYALAQLQGTVDGLVAGKANLETAIADMITYIADPSTREAIISALKAANDAYHDAMDAKEIEEQAKFNEIMALYNQQGVRDELIDRFEDAEGELEDAQDDKDDRLDDIADAEDDIAMWEADLADYAAALALLEDAVDTALSTASAANGVVDAAQDAYDIADGEQEDAQDAYDIAAAALGTLVGIIDGLEGSLNTAAINLAAAQATYDAGIVAATTLVSTTGSAVTTTTAAVATAQALLATWRVRFEDVAPVNGGFFWEDTTTPTILGDDVLGTHTTAVGTPSDTYVQVLTWTWNDDGDTIENAADTYTPLTIGVAQKPALVGTDVAILGNGNISYADHQLSDAVLVLGVQYFVEVGQDDVVYTNLDEMNAAATALGNEDIFDVAPAIGGTLVGADAWTVKYNAIVANLEAIDALATFGVDLAAKQLIYDDFKVIYDDELALLDAAQAIEASTASDLSDANDALSDADGVLFDANDALFDANGDFDAAELAVSDFMDCDVDCIQGNIDEANDAIADWNAEILAIQPIIDAKQAVVDSLQAEYDDYIANLGVLSSLDADLHAAIIALWQELWVMEQEMDALWNAHDLNADLISAYGWGADDLNDLNNELENLNDDLAELNYDLEVAQQALASAQVDEDADAAYIAYLEALVDTLAQRYLNAVAIADTYKALMDAALAG